MVNKAVNRGSTLLALEIVFVVMLGWVLLSSPIGPQGGTVQAANPGAAVGQPGQSPERSVPPEGLPGIAQGPRVVADLGTPTACQGNFDFAGGATQGFTVTNVSGTSLWHLTNNLCRANLTGHSTPWTFYYGQDGTCNYNTGARNASNLISPAISVAGLFPPFQVGFNYLLFVESSSSFDTTFLDISTDNGSTWNPTPVVNKAGLINDNQWHNKVADITAAVGAATSIRFRFRFDSVDNLVNSSTGWHIDDLLVCGQPFDFCVQDDTTKDFIQFNSVTGAYTTKQCSTGFTAGGIGTATTNGSTITLTQNSNPNFNTVTVNTSTRTGTASIKKVNGLSIVAYKIKDTNIDNNTCACP